MARGRENVQTSRREPTLLPGPRPTSATEIVQYDDGGAEAPPRGGGR